MPDRDRKSPDAGARTIPDESIVARALGLGKAIEGLAAIGDVARVRGLAHELVETLESGKRLIAKVVTLASRRAR